MDEYQSCSGWIHVQCYRTNPLSDAPIQNPKGEGPAEIEVIDPMHPLYGRKFEIAYISSRQSDNRFVSVIYCVDMYLNIPISVTQLSIPASRLDIKLTLESVTELISVVQRFDLPCLFPHELSGISSTQNFKTKS